MHPPSISLLAAHAFDVLRRHGLGALAGKAAAALSFGGIAFRLRRRREDAAFDRRLGTSTGGVDRLHRLATLGPHREVGVDHFATSQAEFDAALALVDLASDGLTFVDLGAGRGRVLIMAAEHDFPDIVGVEFAAELIEAAQANLAARAAKLGRDDRIRLIHADAADFDYPDGSLLLYLFNPFGPPVIDLVAERALAAWKAAPRPMRILYRNALHLDAFTRAGWRRIAFEQGTALFAPPGT